MKNQIIFIRGGEVFDTKEQYFSYLKNKSYDPRDQRKGWRDWVEFGLSDTFEMFVPPMPNKQNADYLSWKIWFEKIFPYINNEKLVLIGHSLGGIFLVKYLSENDFPRKIDQLHLVCPPFESSGLVDETVGDFILDVTKISSIQEKVDTIFLYHSKDDPVCPFEHGQKYFSYLPKSNFSIFENRGHFKQSAFPELFENIYKL